MNYDMDEMIKVTQDKLTDAETMAFAFGVGRVVPLPFDGRKRRKAMKEAMGFIKGLDGFLGVHPIGLYKNLLIFDTLNNAKAGRNILKGEGMSTGEVAPIIIPKEFSKEQKNEADGCVEHN